MAVRNKRLAFNSFDSPEVIYTLNFFLSDAHLHGSPSVMLSSPTRCGSRQGFVGKSVKKMLQELLKEIAPVSLHILFETDVIQPKKKKTCSDSRYNTTSSDRYKVSNKKLCVIVENHKITWRKGFNLIT